MLWKSLLSDQGPFAILDAKHLESYQAALDQTPAERPEDWDRLAIMAWKRLAEAEHVKKLDVQYDMLSLTVMSRFRDVTSALIRTLLTKTPSQAPSEWREYQDTVQNVYYNTIRCEPVEVEAKLNIGGKFLKKVEWFLTDHKDAHYARPMPMLTPTVILELNAMMQTIEPALIEASDIDR
jgi:hypothetical protein